MKNSNDTIGKRTRDLPACNAVPQPTAPPRAPIILYYIILYYIILYCIISQSASSPCRRYRNVRRPEDMPSLSFPLMTVGRRGYPLVSLFPIIIAWLLYVVISCNRLYTVPIVPFLSFSMMQNELLCTRLYPLQFLAQMWVLGPEEWGGQTSRQVLYLIKSRQCSERPDRVTTSMGCDVYCAMQHDTYRSPVVHMLRLCAIFMAWFLKATMWVVTRLCAPFPGAI
jgi:hypothetical protein